MCSISQNNKDKIEKISNNIAACSCVIVRERQSLENFLNYPITKDTLSEKEQEVLKRMQYNSKKLYYNIKALFELFNKKENAE